MVIDSSALVALLLGEPETTAFVTAIAGAPTRRVSAPTYLETAIVILARSGPNARERLDRLLNDLDIEVVRSAAIRPMPPSPPTSNTLREAVMLRR